MTGQAVGPKLVRGLGPFAMVALVAGNVIGSGIFVVPGMLAQIAGPASLLVWVGVAIAYSSFLPIFADLVRVWPLSGGLQVYAQKSFGDLAGLETAFLYWVSVVIGNAAFITAFVGYLQVFLPSLTAPWALFLIGQVLLWTLTCVNIAGVREGGFVSTMTTILKILPLIVLAGFLFSSASTDNLEPFAPNGYGALLPAVSLIAWLFVGAESATVPAEEVKGAGVTVGRAVYLGYIVAAVIYLGMALALNLGLPASVIAGSPSPLAVAARIVMGPVGEMFVTLGALISTMGILNGWILVAGRIPFAASHQGFVPAWLGAVHRKRGTPVASLVISSAVTSLLLTTYFSQTLLKAYSFVALASTATSLLAIGFACASLYPLLRRQPEMFSRGRRRWGPMNVVVSLLLVLMMVAGAGATVAFLTLCLMTLPISFHVWRKSRES